MKLKKEQVYINLQGKTKEELTYLWEFLTSNGEKCYRDKEEFSEYPKEYKSLYLCYGSWSGWDDELLRSHTKITIQQLKQIIKPMGTFTPIAMKCTQEQFDAVKPKLKGVEINTVTCFNKYPYLINYYSNKLSNIDIYGQMFVSEFKIAKKVYEEWNEEIFLKACGIEVETLQEKSIRLENELKEVKKQIEEENKPKIGDWVFVKDVNMFYKKSIEYASYKNEKKITNPELIKLLEQEIK